MTYPCEIGLNCPFRTWSEDGAMLCSFPDLSAEGGAYPEVDDWLACPLVSDDSPLDMYLRTYGDAEGARE